MSIGVFKIFCAIISFPTKILGARIKPEIYFELISSCISRFGERKFFTCHKLLFHVCRRNIKPHGLLPEPFILLHIFCVRRLQHDINPQLTVGEIHENEETDFSDAVLIVIRYCEHDFNQEKKKCHDPDNGIRTGERNGHQTQSAEDKQYVGDNDCGEKYIIEREGVQKGRTRATYF